MTHPLVDHAVGLVVYEALFQIVDEIEAFDIEKTEEDYRDWCAEVFIEDRFGIECGNLKMTSVEVRWVVLEVLRRTARDAIEGTDDLREVQNTINLNDGIPDGTEDNHLVSVLCDHGFCPAFQDEIAILCNEVLKVFRKQ